MNHVGSASDAQLFDEFAAWLESAGDPFPEDSVANMAVLVDWHATQTPRGLDELDEDDIVEFLLDWLPTRATLSADESNVYCGTVGAFAEFLGDSGHLVGGAGRGSGLSNLAMSLASAMHDTMTNPASSPKSILTHPGFNPPGQPRYVELLARPVQMPADELEAELRSRMAAFKALPLDEQAAIMDRFLDDELEPVELPFVHIPPDPADVETVASSAPLLRTIEKLRDYLGDAGKPLTQKGNVTLADAKALIELLDTGDQMETTFQDHTHRKNTSARLPGLNSIVNIAKEAGAVRNYKRRLVSTKNWSRKPTTHRAASVYHAVIELGAMGSRDNPYPLIEVIGDVLDGGTVHWLARLLAPDSEIEFEEFVELAEPVLRDELEPYWPHVSGGIESFARDGVSDIFETLERASVVERSGGTIRLTALGRYVVPDDLADAGYVLRRVEDLADASASALVDALDWVPDEQRRTVVDAWQRGIDSIGQVGLIVDLVESAHDAALRLKGFAALEFFNADVVGPAVRRLLDGPSAGHAALYLMSRGLADEAEVGGFVDIGVFVDVLAASLDDPDELCDLFAEAPDATDQDNALEQMVRHPSPLTAAVLDALGQHLPDRKLAKAARKASMRHRSWMANRP